MKGSALALLEASRAWSWTRAQYHVPRQLRMQVDRQRPRSVFSMQEATAMVNESLVPAAVSGDESLGGAMLRGPSQARRRSSCVCSGHAEQRRPLRGAGWGAPMVWTWTGLKRCVMEPGHRQGTPGLLERLVQPPPLLLAWALQGHSGAPWAAHIHPPHHTHPCPMGRLEASYCLAPVAQGPCNPLLPASQMPGKCHKRQGRRVPGLRAVLGCEQHFCEGLARGSIPV